MVYYGGFFFHQYIHQPNGRVLETEAEKEKREKKEADKRKKEETRKKKEEEKEADKKRKEGLKVASAELRKVDGLIVEWVCCGDMFSGKKDCRGTCHN